jgi:hypothetical protein
MFLVDSCCWLTGRRRSFGDTRCTRDNLYHDHGRYLRRHYLCKPKVGVQNSGLREIPDKNAHFKLSGSAVAAMPNLTGQVVPGEFDDGCAPDLERIPQP